MAAYGNPYSRFVAIAKVILPLAAIGLLSTIFLFSRSVDPEKSIPFADVDVDQLVRDRGVNEPDYAAVSSNGTAISVAARSAAPDKQNADLAVVREITARLKFTNGVHTDISSNLGTINTGAGMAELLGDVLIVTSDGYRISTQSLTTALNETRVESREAVLAESPLGTLEAGAMTLTDEPGGDDGYVLVFKNGVKLIYTP